MRSRRVPHPWVVAAVVVVVTALAFLSIQAPEFMGRIQDAELMSMDPAASNFIASGGLVPDDSAPSPATDDASNHAAGKVPPSEGPTTF